MPTAREIIISFFSDLDHPVNFETIQTKTKIKSKQYLRRLLTELKHEGRIDTHYPRQWVRVDQK